MISKAPFTGLANSLKTTKKQDNRCSNKQSVCKIIVNLKIDTHRQKGSFAQTTVRTPSYSVKENKEFVFHP